MEKKEIKHWLKYMAFILVLLCAVIGLILTLIQQITSKAQADIFPEGYVKEEQFPWPTIGIETPFSDSYQCPTLEYLISVPEGTFFKGQFLAGEDGEIRYLIGEASGELDKLMSETLPSTLNAPVPGYQPRYQEAIRTDGFFYDKPAQYRAGSVETRISIRKKEEYTVFYAVAVETDHYLVLYASTANQKLLAEAEALLRNVLMSLKPLDESMTKKEESGGWSEDIENESASFLPISEKLDNDYYLADGVCVMDWVNTTTVPEEIWIQKEDGQKIGPSKEYSYPGTFVFELGECKPGTFELYGRSEGELYYVRFGFMELKEYVSSIDLVEDPAYIVPHSPD